MVRITESRAIELANEAVALGHFEQALKGLPDPRRAQGLRYPLRTVVVIALMSMVCGCDDAEAMEAWGEVNEAWLSTFLEVPHGVPTQDVFLNVTVRRNLAQSFKHGRASSRSGFRGRGRTSRLMGRPVGEALTAIVTSQISTRSVHGTVAPASCLRSDRPERSRTKSLLFQSFSAFST